MVQMQTFNVDDIKLANTVFISLTSFIHNLKNFQSNLEATNKPCLNFHEDT